MELLTTPKALPCLTYENLIEMFKNILEEHSSYSVEDMITINGISTVDWNGIPKNSEITIRYLLFKPYITVMYRTREDLEKFIEKTKIDDFVEEDYLFDYDEFTDEFEIQLNPVEISIKSIERESLQKTAI